MKKLINCVSQTWILEVIAITDSCNSVLEGNAHLEWGRVLQAPVTHIKGDVSSQRGKESVAHWFPCRI